jgi:hypothetical protein
MKAGKNVEEKLEEEEKEGEEDDTKQFTLSTTKQISIHKRIQNLNSHMKSSAS